MLSFAQRRQWRKDLDKQRRRLLNRRSFGPSDLERLLRLLRSADAVVPLAEAAQPSANRPSRLVALRHDMDRDVENAVRFAEWEAEMGLRGSYYVLHDDWYYRAPGATRPSRLVIRALKRIQSLGHEIGLHNNAIAQALKTGIDPRLIVEREIAELRRRGLTVIGTAAHCDELCQRVGFRNEEVFVECPRAEFGSPTRVLSWSDEDQPHREIALQPMSMTDLDLKYEAHTLGYDHYLSDIGGIWHPDFHEMFQRFEEQGGLLQLLIHPLWWALSEEKVRPRHPKPLVQIPSPASPGKTAEDHPSMKILVRGDCCSRRAIDMNSDLFGRAPLMIRDEKSRTDFFLDHLTVGSATRDDVMQYMDVEPMRQSLRYYALCQTDRQTMDVSDADLIVMDNYADMNFQAWRHRDKGWKIWIHPKHLRDRGGFEAEFENLGHLTVEESVALHIRLIEHYRSRNSEIPVLYLNQPVHYYPKLHERGQDFARLGEELERRLPGVFYGWVADTELEPDDLDSSGPGQTLHFTATTYRKMIEMALEKGLGRWLRRRQTTFQI